MLPYGEEEMMKRLVSVCMSDGVAVAQLLCTVSPCFMHAHMGSERARAGVAPTHTHTYVAHSSKRGRKV